MPLDALRPGDLVAVAPGARIPADGTVTAGRSEVDPSLLTGETLPAGRSAPAPRCSAGMLNLTGPLTLARRRARRGHAAPPDRPPRRGRRAQPQPLRHPRRARRPRLRARSSSCSPLAALAWWGATTGDWRLATNVAAAVLIITCPCGLGLAVPAVLTAASGRLFRDGVLLKDGTALERLAEIDAVVFDKTGTLTTGRPVLTNAAAIPRRRLRRRRRARRGERPPARPRHRARPQPKPGSAPPPSPTSPSTRASAPRAGSAAGRSASAAPNGSAPPATPPSPRAGSASAGSPPSPSASPTSSAPTPPPRSPRSGRPGCRSRSSPATPSARWRHSPRGSASPTGPPAPRRRRRSPASTRSAPRAAAC